MLIFVEICTCCMMEVEYTSEDFYKMYVNGELKTFIKPCDDSDACEFEECLCEMQKPCTECINVNEEIIKNKLRCDSDCEQRINCLRQFMRAYDKVNENN